MRVSPVGAGLALQAWQQELFPTRFHRSVASVILIAAFVVTVAAVYVLGPRLKARMDDDAAEVAQATMIALVGTVAGALLVLVWGVESSVVAALDQALVEPSPLNGVRLLVTMLALMLGYTVSRVTKRFVHVGAGRDALTNHQREVLHHLVQILVFVPVVLFVLGLWSFPVDNLLLAGGAIGIVAGLAARQTLGAILAGFVLLFSRPFRIGDWIEVEEAEGIVTDVSIFNTQLRTFADELVMIPNDQVTESSVVNYSRSNRLRVSVDVGVDYGADVRRAAEVAVEAMADLDPVSDRNDPDVVLDRFGDSAVVVTLRFWIDDPSIRRKWAAQNAVVNAVKEAFEAEGIKIPFPQRELAGRDETGGVRLRHEGAARVEPDDAAGRGEAVDARSDGATSSGATADGRDGAAGDDGDAAASDGASADDGTTVDEPVEERDAEDETAADEEPVQPDAEGADDAAATADGDGAEADATGGRDDAAEEDATVESDEDGEADEEDESSPLTDVSEPVEGPGDPRLEPAIRRIDHGSDRSARDDA